MKIISVKIENEEDQRRIELSDGNNYLLKTCYLPPVYTFAEDREITETEEENLRFASDCLRAEKAALQLITRAEQNSFRLLCKLEKRGHQASCVREVIARLCELKLLDDSRYARLWLESRIICQVSSPRRLLAGLCSRGIDRDDAESVLKEVLDEEAETALLSRYAEKLKRKHKIEMDDTDSRRNLKFLLKSEGFSPRIIQQYFDDLD